MSDAIGNVNKAAGPQQISDKVGKADTPPPEPGALDFHKDLKKAVFMGDGETTPAQVAEAVIRHQVEKEGDTELEPFVKSRAAHLHLARQSLQEFNPHLEGQDPDEPIDRGELYTVKTDDQSLKALLTPWAKRLGELQELVNKPMVGMGGKSSTTGHGVFSEGRSLAGAGEPPPGESEAAIMARLGLKPPG